MIVRLLNWGAVLTAAVLIAAAAIMGAETPVALPWAPPLESAPHGRIAVTQDGVKQAPHPKRAFRGEQCPQQPSVRSGEADVAPSPHTWSIRGLVAGAPLVLSGHQGQSPILPPAPVGMLDASGAELGRPTGVVLAAGHVDDEDGRLSPWAELHRLEPCMEIALADAHGRVHRYAVTDLYTVPQNDVTKEDIFRTSGLPELVMVTCSGPSVRDAGGAFRFAYSHNLIVRAQPIGR